MLTIRSATSVHWDYAAIAGGIEEGDRTKRGMHPSDRRHRGWDARSTGTWDAGAGIGDRQPDFQPGEGRKPGGIGTLPVGTPLALSRGAAS